ncbi:MAG: glycosyltransferase family 4 protein [Phycisphaerales bacterium]|nr:glycosyltransferase family 4 protein [Phycisphaerales bacterium]
MSTLLADALVLVFTDWFTLRRWHESGQMDRDWALGDATGRHYRRLVLVTCGHEDDRAFGEALKRRELVTGEAPPPIQLIMNDARTPLQRHLDTAPRRVAEAIADARTVVVRTHHMAAGRLALRITAYLRKEGKSVGLLARGSYLWSRFAAHEYGTASREAIHAAAVERELCTAADAFVGTTGKMVDDLAWRHSLDPGKGMIVPNYVLTDGPVSSAQDREPGLLVYAGKLVKRKRVELLIQAVARLPDQVRNSVRLDIIGDGPMQPELARLATNLTAPVRFLPRKPHIELLEVLRRCQLFLHASELEGHPRAVIDAMATGCPVLVADTPGLGSVIQHGATGIRVPADPDAFATAISELLNDEDWREMLGSAAARVTRMMFGLDQIIPLELAAQQLALERGTSRPARILDHCDTAQPVRWTLPLLDEAPADAARAWADALQLYTENISPVAEAEFRAALHSLLNAPHRRHEAA